MLSLKIITFFILLGIIFLCFIYPNKITSRYCYNMRTQKNLLESPAEFENSYPAMLLKEQKGNWELDLNSRKLFWSPCQYKIYGYEPNEFNVNEDFFILKTTHVSELDRITKIIDEALKNDNEYSFKRHIIKKNGSLGFVETHAKILRSDSGAPYKIIGTTINIENKEANETNNDSLMFFNQMYSKYKSTILFQVYKVTLDEDVAKDLCQEIFIKAWRNVSKYEKEKGQIYTWLINIARNHCKDYFKSQHYQKRKVTSPLENISGDYISLIKSDKFDLKRLLSYLNPEQREIIEMLFIDGFSHSEVAKIKSLPLGTVKTKSRTVIQRLRKLAGVSYN